MIAAEKLLEEDKVETISNDGNRTEARVVKSGRVKHTVILFKRQLIGAKAKKKYLWHTKYKRLNDHSKI